MGGGMGATRYNFAQGSSGNGDEAEEGTVAAAERIVSFLDDDETGGTEVLGVVSSQDHNVLDVLRHLGLGPLE